MLYFLIKVGKFLRYSCRFMAVLMVRAMMVRLGDLFVGYGSELEPRVLLYNRNWRVSISLTVKPR